MWVDPPDKIVIIFDLRWAFEGRNLHALWVHAFKYLANSSVFATGIERLEYDEKTVGALGVQYPLQRNKFFS